MAFEHLKKILLGAPLETEMIKNEKITKVKALAVLSSDALSSVAYATEEILIPLAAFGTFAVSWSLPIALAITFLLFVVTLSYRQVIDAYPSGGGAYIIAKVNLGVRAGLIAGASLLIDYVLTVAVSVSSGIENIVSAFPELLPFKVLLGVLVILILTILNLRGIRESADAFTLPTYFFIFSLTAMIVVGGFRLITGGVPMKAPILHETYPWVPLFLILKAFSSGCSALTGVEAISNAIPIFKDPSQKNAKVTLTGMALLLGFLFIGITLLAHTYGILPAHEETAISALARQIFGKEWFYYLVQFSTATILVLAANTSYAGFPRLASLMAADRYLPRQMASLGDRLVFSNGIIWLSLTSILLVYLFGGKTHFLIPLYAIGVFLSFTLSQAGMIVYHLKTRHRGWGTSLTINCVGMLTTFLVLMVTAITKFAHGAWIVMFLIGLLVVTFLRIHFHYGWTARKLARASDSLTPLLLKTHRNHIAVVPVAGVHPGVYNAIRYAQQISEDIRVCTVELDHTAQTIMDHKWTTLFPDIPLYVLKSPFRSIIGPILDFVEQTRRSAPQAIITVIIPEFITNRWYHQFLHNQTAFFLYTSLRWKKNIVVTSVRYHLDP